MTLTEHEKAVLDFESQWWKHPGAKEQAVTDQFGMTITRYQELVALMERPEALAAYPMLVKRLHRLRDTRRRQRVRGLGL